MPCSHRISLMVLSTLAAGLSVGCAGNKPQVAAAPAQDSIPAAAALPPFAATPDTVTLTVRDPELEQQAARLELKLLERDAQIEELQARLDEARQEVVRAMAKLQTFATRAEAASGMAEAEVAVQSLKVAAGQGTTPEYSQAMQLLDQSSAAFNKLNYGGALYLANQAKRLAGTGKGRLSASDGEKPRPGETAFALPVKMQTVRRSNVREGPGTNYRVLFTVEGGAWITAYSYTDTWVRMTDDSGRSGWVVRSLVGRGKETGP